MKSFQIAILLLQYWNHALGQKQDYKIIRDSLTTLSCTPVDSLTLYQTIARLEAFDTNTISQHIELYYKDLGWCYYRLQMKTKDPKYFEMAINSFEKALYHKPDYSTVLWDNSFCYYFLGNCEKGKMYMDRYKKATRRKYWNREQIQRISKRCDK